MPSPTYYTTAEVADILRINVQTARKYIRTGYIKAEQLNNSPRSPYRVSDTALTEWAKRRRV